MLQEVGACEDSQLYLAITHDYQGRVPNDTNKIDLKFNTYSEYMNALLGYSALSFVTLLVSALVYFVSL